MDVAVARHAPAASLGISSAQQISNRSCDSSFAAFSRCERLPSVATCRTCGVAALASFAFARSLCGLATSAVPRSVFDPRSVFLPFLGLAACQVWSEQCEREH